MARVSRQQFIESIGASCSNWTWSWSFINNSERFVVFGAWNFHTHESASLILSKAWEISTKGRRQPGFREALDNIRHIEESNYRLFTFPMLGRPGTDGPSKISRIIPEITERSLARLGDRWFACDPSSENVILPTAAIGRSYYEGDSKEIVATVYERNIHARNACLEHYGYACIVCRIEFERLYGDRGKNFIHVHHHTPISKIGTQYKVDPLRDLVPICPNCHAMIHRREPMLTVDQLREILRNNIKISG